MMNQRPSKIAIIDLGTNTFNLLIAQWKGKEYVTEYRERIAVKLGMGGINDGLITMEGQARALHGLNQFKETLTSASVSAVYAFGTSALRNARNGNEVVQKIKEQTGIEVRIISGDEEAALIYAGVRKAVRLGDGVSLIVDIGGGSVETIIGNEDGILWKQSFEIGAQRLLERFQKHDPILTSEINQLHHHFEISLTALTEAIQKYQPVALVGSSGTFDTLSEIDGIRRNQPISPESPETPLTVESFHRIYSELVQLNRAQRLQVPGMIEMRVDMIVVACCLIDWLIAKGNFQAIRVSSYSLKEGVLASLETSEI